MTSSPSPILIDQRLDTVVRASHRALSRDGAIVIATIERHWVDELDGVRRYVLMEIWAPDRPLVTTLGLYEAGASRTAVVISEEREALSRVIESLRPKEM